MKSVYKCVRETVWIKASRPFRDGIDDRYDTIFNEFCNKFYNIEEIRQLYSIFLDFSDSFRFNDSLRNLKIPYKE